MATAQARPYRQVGVFLPVQTRSAAPDRVAREWPTINKNHVASKGFVLVDMVSTINRATVLIVQSVQTGELLVQKLVRPNTEDPDYEYEEPLELRISTWQDTLPSAEFPDGVPLGALPRDAPFFNKLRFWQHFKPDDVEDEEDVEDGEGGEAYSLFFE